ncbi:hypothetical protein KFK09_007795 [Dendrobium nobile]|uniref:Uncharacterized protein n=1 Tax=Dendrobium nobile TaxID=94219 RepID=A0A8T3BXU8_DENNO|nr:hypothetical protein KFK09_007795 [Dendrobium nobile]
MAASSRGFTPQPLGFRIRRVRAFPPLQGPRTLEFRRRKVQEGILYCCSDSEIRKLTQRKSPADTLEEWRRMEVKNSPRRFRARAIPATPLSFARSKGLSKQKDFYPRCNNPKNNAPQSRDTPPERDTGIGSEKDWGINLLDEHVNESGINQDGSTWYQESGEERGDNGYKCRWNKMGGQSHDGSSEWKENWWEKSDWTGYKELGAEKSGKNADGDSWWETWQELCFLDNDTNMKNKNYVEGLSKQKDFYPRCNNPKNNAPQSRGTPPERDTGIGSEKDWGINLLDEHVNESGINQGGSTWFQESGKNVEIMATSADGTKWAANLMTVLQNGKKMYGLTSIIQS